MKAMKAQHERLIKMYKMFYSILTIFWLLDIMNFEFMRIFDTTYPLNGWFWLFVWFMIPSVSAVNNK